MLFVSVLCAADEQRPANVTLEQLVKSPAEYDGKSVEVRGFLLQEFENSALYPSHEWRYGKQAIWVTTTDEMSRRRDRLNRHYVLLKGIFDAKSQGHLGQYHGTIVVKKFALLQDDMPPGNKGSK